ncbi:hypothetical protein [Stenotrophomonas sp. ZAC14A_NAIMI4_1]|uniref:hypothetical protein n=1 Tax=Stenotrophomonas sp. ZAC14A_NAIMI4_1 TaxID=2072412 RepID=UPI000D53C9EC|nr:hypothetical protein [Stenotrophomonas sp. ZAC14A_NAIMI4_1]AWH46056.1 hypothetical protein C1926_13965 [Stenotrophomonas sp. ZAC14A_NAIMI4_1]
MSTLDQVLQLASKIPDDSLRESLVQLTRALGPHLLDFEEMWTFAGLAKISGIAQDDPALLDAIRILSSPSPVRVLDMHFLYFSPEGDGEGEAMEDREIADAYRLGYLVDPQTGAELHDFEDHLVPYFQVRREASRG